MAVYPSPTSSSAVYLRRSASLPVFTNFTIMGWFRLDAPSTGRRFFYLGNSDNDFAQPYIDIGTFGGPSIQIYDGTDFHDDNGAASLSHTSTWYHLVYRKTGDLHEVLLSDESGATFDVQLEASLNVPANVTPLFVVALVYRQTAVQDVRAWDAALTEAEIRAERDSSTHVKTASLHLATPLPTHLDLADDSGNGRDWTAVVGPHALITAGAPDLGGGGSVPDAPTNLVATASGFEHIALTWTDNSDDETEFEIQRCAGAACSGFSTIAVLGPGVTSYTDPATAAAGLFPDQLYRYRIRATNLVGSSDWSAIAEATTAANRSARFPGTAGTYYEVTGEPTYGSLSELGRGGCVAYVRIDASGYATILTALPNYARAFLTSVEPDVADENEYDYLSEMSTWFWFGVREGRLVFEAHDGRIAARGIVGGTAIVYPTAFARDQAVADFRALYASLPYSDGLTVPILTHETSSFGITNYFATFPNGVDAPHGDLEQSILVTGPALTPGVWHRVGYRWVSVQDGNEFSSSTIELWADCAKVAEGAWDVDIVANHGVSAMGGLGAVKGFVGGDPNDLHRQGQTVTPLNLYDVKIWSTETPTDVQMAGECACVGVRPPLWWKLRDADDITDYGSGTISGATSLFYDARPVGTITDGSTAVSSPCNVITPPPAEPPDEEEEEPPTPGTTPASVVGTTRIRLIRRIRRAPHLSSEQHRITYDAFELDLATGIGLVSGQGSDPIVYLSWSDDGGRTFSNEYPMSIGALGQYFKRVTWNRLGQSRDRVFQISMSDPVDFAILAAYLQIRPGRG